MGLLQFCGLPLNKRNEREQDETRNGVDEMGRDKNRDERQVKDELELGSNLKLL